MGSDQQSKWLIWPFGPQGRETLGTHRLCPVQHLTFTFDTQITLCSILTRFHLFPCSVEAQSQVADVDAGKLLLGLIFYLPHSDIYFKNPKTVQRFSFVQLRSDATYQDGRWEDAALRVFPPQRHFLSSSLSPSAAAY